jgi:hypothetical protein
MNTNPPLALRLRCLPRRCAIVLLALAAITTARATLPEPDNILYGNITIAGAPITAAQTDVAVEARRTIDGPAIARYQMGSNPGAGNFYTLQLALESLLPVVSTNASQTGEPLFIVVTDPSGVLAQSTYNMQERASVQRLDFGAPITDADENGLPDLWELAWFGAAGQDPDAITLNGQTVRKNYIAGTNPSDPNDAFRVTISRSGMQVTVAFLGRQAQGPGYEGLTRVYTLQTTTNLVAAWLAVSNLTDVPGADQMITLQTNTAGPRSFYRAGIRLDGP